LRAERPVDSRARRFWNWARDEDAGSRILYLDGVIAEESWFDDDITPKAFKDELMASGGDIVEDVKGRSMYIEVLAKKTEAADG